MNFLMIGDSWGKGEYKLFRPNQKYLRFYDQIGSKDIVQELVPNTGLDYYLTQLGHTVTNLSAGSACNFGQLRHCRTVLEQCDQKFDNIIWLHTEPIRDVKDTILEDEDGPRQFPHFESYRNFQEAMAYINQENYAFAQREIHDRYKIDFIAIGALGKLYPSINNYPFARHKIMSWAAELLGQDDVPDVTFWREHDREVFERYKFDKPSAIKAIDDAKKYCELMTFSDKYPDGSHPARQEYERLATRIIKMLAPG